MVGGWVGGARHPSHSFSSALSISPSSLSSHFPDILIAMHLPHSSFSSLRSCTPTIHSSSSSHQQLLLGGWWWGGVMGDSGWGTQVETVETVRSWGGWMDRKRMLSSSFLTFLIFSPFTAPLTHLHPLPHYPSPYTLLLHSCNLLSTPALALTLGGAGGHCFPFWWEWWR